MSQLPRRLLILVLAESLLLLAVHALAPLLILGSERYLLAGTASGLGLAGLWLWSDWSLLIATEVLAIVLAVGMQQLPHAAGRTISSSGTPAVRVVTLAPAGAVALTVATVCLAALCGWLLTARRSPWPVVVLAGSMLLVRADVSRIYEDRFPLFLVAAVALVVCVYSPNGRRLWLAIPGAVFSLLLVGAAWQLPVARQALPLGWMDSVSGLPAESAPSAGQQDGLTLEGAFHPSDRPVMEVSDDRPDLQLYWRMTVYDHYDGHGWTTTASSARLVPALTVLAGGLASDGGVLLTRVHLFEPARALVSVGEPVEADIPAVAVQGPGGLAPAQLQSPDILSAGTEYQTAGRLSPMPIVSSYERSALLQLPPEPERVRALARRLAGSTSGVLQRALVLAWYLRRGGGFTYDITAGSPTDGDAVDNFLFHSRRGYCDQFASALVVLARSVGIPARLIAGYATGTQQGSSFLVRERDVHSWVEVFTPSGWVALDPTPGFNPAPPPSSRAVRTVPLPPRGVPIVRQPSLHPLVNQGPPSVPRVAASPSGGNRVPLAAPLIGGIAAGVLVLLLAAGYAILPRSLEKLYRGLLRSTPRRYGRLAPGETPLQFAERFRAAPAEYADMRRLTGLYVRHRYAGKAATEEELREARRAWWRLRRRWILRRIF